MLEPGLGVSGRDEVLDGVERLIDPVPGPCASRSQPPLDLGPSLFDRVEIGGVRWQVGDLGTGQVPVDLCATTYQQDAPGNDDDAYFQVQTPATNQALLRVCKQRSAKYAE